MHDLLDGSALRQNVHQSFPCLACGSSVSRSLALTKLSHWERRLGSPPIPKFPRLRVPVGVKSPDFGFSFSCFLWWTLRDRGSRLAHYMSANPRVPKASQVGLSNSWQFHLSGNWQSTQPRAALNLCPGTFGPRSENMCRSLQGLSPYC